MWFTVLGIVYPPIFRLKPHPLSSPTPSSLLVVATYSLLLLVATAIATCCSSLLAAPLCPVASQLATGSWHVLLLELLVRSLSTHNSSAEFV